MKIGCFGCSFTGGTGGIKDQGKQKSKETRFVTWPDELAKLMPKCQISNFGRGGLSMQGILFLFEKYSPYFDYNIVKLTDHSRMSCIHPSLGKLQEVRKNYFAWDNVEAQKMLVFSTVGFNENHVQIPWSKSHARTYHSMWLRHMNKDYERVQADAIGKYLASQANFTFKHTESIPRLLVQSTENNIDNFNDYLFDGHHLDIYGCQLEAQWIKTVIERDLYV